LEDVVRILHSSAACRIRMRRPTHANFCGGDFGRDAKANHGAGETCVWDPGALAPWRRWSFTLGRRRGPRPDIIKGNVGAKRAQSPPAASTTPIAGPLTASGNPNYFRDARGAVLILSGSQTWNTLQDWGSNGSPHPLDFDAYVNFLAAHGKPGAAIRLTGDRAGASRP